MRTIRAALSTVTLMTGSLLLFQNCSKAGFGTDGANFSSLSSTYGGPAVCDPLSGANGGTSVSAANGLVGQLIYETQADQVKLGTPNSFGELIQRGTVAPITLFMSSINVPQRAFTEGFSTDSAVLTDASTGQKLVEWFGIDMTSVLKLTGTDAAGFYQFATISDDGSLLDATVNGQNVALVENDLLHSTAAKCSQTAIYLDARSALNIRYRYFQGPRTDIASIISWRKVSGAKPDTANCAQAVVGDGGWSVIPAKNYFLPSGMPTNPCH